MPNKKASFISLPDSDPVTKAFLIKTLMVFIGFIVITVVPLTFKIGGMLATYEELSAIPTSDIKRAIEYAVETQPERKEFYRSYMSNNDLKLQSHEERIKSMEEWSRDIKAEMTEIKKAISLIEKSQAINTKILLGIEKKINKN